MNDHLGGCVIEEDGRIFAPLIFKRKNQ